MLREVTDPLTKKHLALSATSNTNHLANVHPQLADLHFVLDPLLLVFETEQLSSLITPLGRVNTF